MKSSGGFMVANSFPPLEHRMATLSSSGLDYYHFQWSLRKLSESHGMQQEFFFVIVGML